MTKEERELTQNITGWLFNKLEQGQVQVTSAEAEYVIQAKMWLLDINQGRNEVIPSGESDAQDSSITDANPKFGGGRRLQEAANVTGSAPEAAAE